MKKQVVLVKGGEAKENYKDFYDFLEKQEFNPYKEVKKRWNRNMGETLGEDYEVLEIPIFDKYFADYKSWKIMFEKVFPFLNGDVIFVGHSMGAIFLAKYFDEENNSELLEQTKKIILVAPPFKDIEGDVLGTFNFKNTNFKKLKNIQEKIIIFGSKDDFVVPFNDIKDYRKVLSKAEYKIFEKYGHFLGEEVPEIIEEIKKIL
ncbi:MAG: alpha/beta hydrolase [Candidatus Gracilibacteria bacterium]|nr:alpha/beta hydrolase [Candidatus Gracilibacteria bacterium]